MKPSDILISGNIDINRGLYAPNGWGIEGNKTIRSIGVVALKLNRKFVGIELNPAYVEMANKRIKPYLEQRRITEV